LNEQREPVRDRGCPISRAFFAREPALSLPKGGDFRSDYFFTC
jgi:hypothetical protein